MATSKPVRHFERGLVLLQNRRYAEAALQFQVAVQLERELGAVRPQMRYRSFLGLSRTLAGRAKVEDVRLCEQAAKLDHFDPVLQLNLGKVYLRTGKRTRAITSFRLGLEMDPGNRELQQLFRRTDRRAAPVLPMLGRNHPVNVSLGRLRAKWTRRKAAAG
ncbi:MAG TPA: hypothetical protein VD788_13345 [Candidatus Polarisedimenticolaceae bacterium]|nr:hypothetical protein [Candidatus Polarisedimenticolaceae bacterium]